MDSPDHRALRPAPELRFLLLGPVEAHLGDRRLELGRRRERALPAAADRAGMDLSKIWDEIDSKMTNTVMHPLSAPAPNVSISPSLQLSRLFPDG
ncbi:hypothetical protein QRX60_43175 [Amycolatopsis mongoliensis]|uniref:Uncharacterized protein n=1 Tax=Amycolatopsis mongoliensis TaxID=715475 RepID=A0A9Y2JN76_9PSEU|nr:hypothetical protein [Amycolatopsis sp. 4-36]WIY00790.1 hypothetical protein QRX60_43175 [Amycolatopsis sp. 4-36]